ncbi:MAG: hypothetical protein ABR600_01220 [Actinomycetota bacterium]
MAIRGRGDRQIRFARILGLSFIVAGFTAIGFSWNGAAKVACVDCQLPYLLSGGAAGVGLVLVGGVALIVAQMRVTQLAFQEQVRHINQAIVRVAGLATGGPNGQGQVVAGQSTYHRPDCRLVQGKQGLERVNVETAVMSGLTPCRVCNPATPDVTVSAG